MLSARKTFAIPSCTRRGSRLVAFVIGWVQRGTHTSARGRRITDSITSATSSAVTAFTNRAWATPLASSVRTTVGITIDTSTP